MENIHYFINLFLIPGPFPNSTLAHFHENSPTESLADKQPHTTHSFQSTWINLWIVKQSNFAYNLLLLLLVTEA